MRRSSCKCAVSKKVSAVWRYGGRPRPACGRFAAGTRSPRSDGSHPAEARLERKIPAAAKGDPVPRAARSTDACAVLTSTPAAQRADTAGCTADRYSRAARQQAHVERMRHAALPCGEPTSETATQTVLRTVCAPARVFSDGMGRCCNCRAANRHGGILRATDAARRRFSVAGIARTVCHNHTILWGK